MVGGKKEADANYEEAGGADGGRREPGRREEAADVRGATSIAVG